MNLLERVADAADRQGVRIALLGAAALAVHGVSRSTHDLDLLTTDPRALDAATWTSFDDLITTEVRRGDADDPLAGVARFQAAGERDIDLIVCRPGWPDEVLARAVATTIGQRRIPVVEVPDLILLKLYAGGSQDRWDIEQLLAAGKRAALVRAVESRLVRLPERARALWTALTASTWK